MTHTPMVELAEMVALYRHGWTLAAIAARFGVSGFTVRAKLLRYGGVTMRQRSDYPPPTGRRTDPDTYRCKRCKRNRQEGAVFWTPRPGTSHPRWCNACANAARRTRYAASRLAEVA